VIETIRAGLGQKFVGLCQEIRAHTPRVDVLNALHQVRASDADLLVSVGGGSIIDATKAVQLAVEAKVENETELLRFAQFADGRRGDRAGDYSLLTGSSGLPQIAIPTTLSGAEHSNNAGVTDTEKGLKEGYRAPSLYPRHIIYDPALAVKTPQWLWLSTAIRSLDHAIEGYCSADTTPYHDGHFLHAMRLFAESLPMVRDNPEDLLPRSLNQQAVWLACCGLGKVGHGASHGIGYLLGAVCGVPHGYTSCVMLPAVLRWNAVANGERQQAIAQALGAQNQDASTAVASLVASLGLPGSLRAVGVKEQQLEKIADLASRHPVVRRNPRSISNPAQVMELLKMAW
jgi:maleylacetate reductase